MRAVSNRKGRVRLVKRQRGTSRDLQRERGVEERVRWVIQRNAWKKKHGGMGNAVTGTNYRGGQKTIRGQDGLLSPIGGSKKRELKKEKRGNSARGGKGEIVKDQKDKKTRRHFYERGPTNLLVEMAGRGEIEKRQEGPWTLLECGEETEGAKTGPTPSVTHNLPRIRKNARLGICRTTGESDTKASVQKKQGGGR